MNILDSKSIVQEIERRRDAAKDIRDRDAYQAMLDSGYAQSNSDLIDIAMRAFSMWVYLYGQLSAKDDSINLMRLNLDFERQKNATLEHKAMSARAQLCMEFCDGYTDDALAFMLSLEATIETERRRAVQEYVQKLDRRAAGG